MLWLRKLCLGLAPVDCVDLSAPDSILSAFVRELLTISCLPTFVQVRVRKLRWKTRAQNWSFTKVALTLSELCSQPATLCSEALHNKESAGLITLKCNCISSASSLCLID